MLAKLCYRVQSELISASARVLASARYVKTQMQTGSPLTTPQMRVYLGTDHVLTLFASRRRQPGSVDALGVNNQRALFSGRFKTQCIRFDVQTTEQSDTHGAGAPPPSRSRLHSGWNPISNPKFQRVGGQLASYN